MSHLTSVFGASTRTLKLRPHGRLLAAVAAGLVPAAFSPAALAQGSTTSAPAAGAPASLAVRRRQYLMPDRHPGQFVREIVLVDKTWSFAGDLPSASEAAWKHINRSATTARDEEIYVIGVGTRPRPGGATAEEAAYIRGVRSRSKAKAEFEAAFEGDVNREVGGGTDWVGALQRAAQYASLSPKPAAAHLIVFGDLIADPRKDPVTHRLLARYQRVEGWNFAPLQCFDSVTLMYVDDDVRLALAGNQSFQSLGAAVMTAKEARARPGVIPPAPHIRGADAPAGNAGAPWLLYGLGGAAIVVLAALLMRPANAGTRGGNGR
jgi:hypothetical protein